MVEQIRNDEPGFRGANIVTRRLQEAVAGVSMLVFALSAMVLSGIGDALLGF
jgi:hypothetical protein